MSDFQRRAPAFHLRRATPDDAAFLRRLFLAVAAEALPLPAPLLDMQYESQRFAYAEQFPSAIDVVAERDGAPIGHMLIDWTSADGFHAVDLAVLPGERAGAAGLHLLRSWVHIADLFQRTAILRVRPGAPAIALYDRLGFFRSGAEDIPLLMVRSPRPKRLRQTGEYKSA